jgi:hypothetical protein
MRHTLFPILAAVTLMAETSHAQLTAEPVIRFVVPEANALSVSIDVHGDTVLLGTIDPEAYVFQFDGGRWWMERLSVPGAQRAFKEVALDEDDEDDEDVALIGASPNAYVFRFDGAKWVHEATLSDDRGDGGFGYTVDVHGDLAVVGTRSRDVQVFRFNGADWVREARLAPAPKEDGKAPYGFADYVAVGEERVLVSKSSTIGDGFEGVYAFRRDGAGWHHEDTITLSDTETVFQGEIAIDGDVALIDADYDDVVHVFRFNGFRWEREAILEPPELEHRNCSCLPIPPGDQEICDDGTPNFGVSVALDGDLALVGANLDDVAATDSGAAYLYRYDGAQWRYELLLQGEPASACGGYFGRLVALHDRRALVRQGHSAYFFRIR